MHHEFGIRQNETNGKRYAHEASGAWIYDGHGFRYETIPGYREPSRLWLMIEELGTDGYSRRFDIRNLFRNLKEEIRNG